VPSSVEFLGPTTPPVFKPRPTTPLVFKLGDPPRFQTRLTYWSADVLCKVVYDLLVLKIMHYLVIYYMASILYCQQVTLG